MHQITSSYFDVLHAFIRCTSLDPPLACVQTHDKNRNDSNLTILFVWRHLHMQINSSLNDRMSHRKLHWKILGKMILSHKVVHVRKDVSHN